MHKPRSQFKHSDLVRERFFDGLTVVLTAIHRRLSPLISDRK